MPTLTYREAARRVHRSIKTVKRWRRNGMPMGWDKRNGQRVRVVDERVLLEWWRGRMTADPVHQARLRAAFTVPAPATAPPGQSGSAEREQPAGSADR